MISKPTYKFDAILFDLDRTIYDFEACEEVALKRLFLRHGIQDYLNAIMIVSVK